MRILKFFSFCLSLAFLAPLAFSADLKKELTIYTYDSFMVQGGIGPEIIPLFEKKENCQLRVLLAGDGGLLLTRIELDARRGKFEAQVVVGIDQHLWKLIQPWTESWGAWEPQGYQKLVPETKMGNGFLPYDYGALALIADFDSLKKLGLKPPKSLTDLLNPEWKRNIILEDPRTSTPGLSLLLFTQNRLGNKVWDFWKALSLQWLTLTPGWDSAYGLFLKKEAPLVWSYLTSQAYHQENPDSGMNETPPKSSDKFSQRYQAILFEDGQPLQIEGVAMLRGSFKHPNQRELAKKWMEFLISPEVQNRIPKKIWMMPARQDSVLPESFKNLPRPKRLITLTPDAKEIKSALTQWRQSIENPLRVK